MNTESKVSGWNCSSCKKSITQDEMAVTKKLINRAATIYYCVDCLANMFEVSEEDIRKKIVYFKKMGCTLFECNQQKI